MAGLMWVTPKRLISLRSIVAALPRLMGMVMFQCGVMLTELLMLSTPARLLEGIANIERLNCSPRMSL
jgi:hypothetical protein